MATSGGLEYRGRSLPFAEARCEWFGPPYGLTVFATGGRCSLSMVNLREDRVRELPRMVGHTWVMDLERETINPGIFRGEGGLVIDGVRPYVWKAWVRCKRSDEDLNVLIVDVSLVVVDEQDGGAPEDMAGVVSCDIESRADRARPPRS